MIETLNADKILLVNMLITKSTTTPSIIALDLLFLQLTK